MTCDRYSCVVVIIFWLMGYDHDVFGQSLVIPEYHANYWLEEVWLCDSSLHKKLKDICREFYWGEKSPFNNQPSRSKREVLRRHRRYFTDDCCNTQSDPPHGCTRWNAVNYCSTNKKVYLTTVKATGKPESTSKTTMPSTSVPPTTWTMPAKSTTTTAESITSSLETIVTEPPRKKIQWPLSALLHADDCF